MATEDLSTYTPVTDVASDDYVLVGSPTQFASQTKAFKLIDKANLLSSHLNKTVSQYLTVPTPIDHISGIGQLAILPPGCTPTTPVTDAAYSALMPDDTGHTFLIIKPNHPETLPQWNETQCFFKAGTNRTGQPPNGVMSRGFNTAFGDTPSDTSKPMNADTWEPFWAPAIAVAGGDDGQWDATTERHITTFWPTSSYWNGTRRLMQMNGAKKPIQMSTGLICDVTHDCERFRLIAGGPTPLPGGATLNGNQPAWFRLQNNRMDGTIVVALTTTSTTGSEVSWNLTDSQYTMASPVPIEYKIGTNGTYNVMHFRRYSDGAYMFSIASDPSWNVDAYRSFRVLNSGFTPKFAFDAENDACGFHGVAATTRQALAANATDLASAITLVNDIKAKLIAKGLCQ